ncbi:unnamed protein product [Phyllotreta striolata]|uniref:Uncharacterized protein n=1 Tax=Phyllotreta striolata TaxID=444603 RepID=A0A9N9TGP1_PHYSR|nr:unnamed protein product [Phyllotreta striolata]
MCELEPIQRPPDLSCKLIKPMCLSLFDRLAWPKAERVLAVYKCHAYHMTRPRVELIKSRLQELYAMTAEETEAYFLMNLEKQRQLQKRRELKKKMKMAFLKKRKQQQVDCAYKFLKRLLVMGMRFAAKNPVPPLLCVRLRILSDVILEQLCDLRGISQPSREDPDKCGLFMITIADWFAIAVEVIYYIVQHKKNVELDDIFKRFAMEAADCSKSEFLLQTTDPQIDFECPP